MKRALITIALTFIVLFPSPFIIVKDYQRLNEPPIDPEALGNVSQIPDKPHEIEEWVENKIEYRYDFEVYGTLWYVPTPDEILKNGEGDCKARAILLATIFERKDIEYELHMSSFHWWVSYESNNRTWAEDETISLRKGDEWRFPDIGKTIDKMWSVRSEYYDMLWGSMPDFRQLFFLTCLTYLWVPLKFYEKGWEILLKLRTDLSKHYLKRSKLSKISTE